MLKLTKMQQSVLDELRKIGRENLFKYRESSEYLFKTDCERVMKGDEYCVFGLGALTYQISGRLGFSPGSVLGIFWALHRKGLVIREESHPKYHRPRYWWPAGLAAELSMDLSS